MSKISGGYRCCPKKYPYISIIAHTHTPNIYIDIDSIIAMSNNQRVPSGKLTVCYGKSPFIVYLPTKNGDFP